ncbi:MAG: AAA family ATPase [Taibaiella sp.]|nr:AAA family ATPase [Taibaiella sp.]
MQLILVPNKVNMSFPYITQLHVNDCFAYQDFDIPAAPLTEFKHIIITGKNGCGKTTILNSVAAYFIKTKGALNVNFLSESQRSLLKMVIVHVQYNHFSEFKREKYICAFFL